MVPVHAMVFIAQKTNTKNGFDTGEFQISPQGAGRKKGVPSLEIRHVADVPVLAAPTRGVPWCAGAAAMATIADRIRAPSGTRHVARRMCVAQITQRITVGY